MSRLLEKLRKYKDDRGMMADLRCVHVESKKHRAWPALHRLGVPISDRVSAYIAGFFAIHPQETAAGNFGITCKGIEQRRKEKRSDDDKLTPTERRFQHLLTAEPGEELYSRVLRLVLMAKSQSVPVPVNYEKLEVDLRYWTDRTKLEWASAFWAQGGSDTEEGTS